MLDVQSAAELRIVCQFHGVDLEPVEVGAAQSVVDPWPRPPTRSDSSGPRGSTAGRWPRPNTSSKAVAPVRRRRRWSPPPPLLVLTFAGDAGSAEHWCGRVIDEAVNGRVRTWQAFFEVVRAHLMLRRGDPADGVSAGVLGVGSPADPGVGVSIGYPAAVLFTALTELGDRHRLEELLRHCRCPRRCSTPSSVFSICTHEATPIACGRAIAGHQRFPAVLGLLMERWGADLPLVAPWRLDLAEANIALGRRDAARDLVTEQLTRPGIGRWTRGIAMRVLAELSEADERVSLLRKSLELLKSCGDGLALARTQRRLDEARGGATDDGPARRPGRGSVAVLSDSERRVAELAATGHTNREISALLYITVSTVEQHLTRVYRKLGVKGRAELPRDLAPLGI